MSRIGVGKIRFGVFIDGKLHIVYERDVSNVRSGDDQ
jgi:hypothetical protein